MSIFLIKLSTCPGIERGACRGISSLKMRYTRPKENSKVFEFLNLKNISIALFVSMISGFIFIQSSWVRRSKLKDFHPNLPITTTDSISSFDATYDEKFRRQPANPTIFNNFDSKDLEFLIYESRYPNDRKKNIPFSILQLKQTPYIESISESLKDNEIDSADRLDFIEYDESPKFTADGENIVFCRRYSYAARSALFIMSIDCNGKTKLLKRITSVSNCSYSFTPDGKSLVYTNYIPGSDYFKAVYKIDLDGKNETSLFPCKSGSNYSSPIFVRLGGKERVYFIDKNSVYYKDLDAACASSLNIVNAKTISPPAFGAASLTFLISTYEGHIMVCNPSKPITNCCYDFNSLIPGGIDVNNGLNYPKGSIQEAILTKDGQIIYYIDRSRNNARKVLMKANIDGKNVVELKTNFMATSISLRPKLGKN